VLLSSSALALGAAEVLGVGSAAAGEEGLAPPFAGGGAGVLLEGAREGLVAPEPAVASDAADAAALLGEEELGVLDPRLGNLRLDRAPPCLAEASLKGARADA